MTEIPGIALMVDMLQSPPWLMAWLGWMAAVNLTGALFIREREGQAVLAALALAFVTMTVIHEAAGYVRLLGLGHVLFWTPLLLWLRTRLPLRAADTGMGKWLRVLVVTDLVSLVIDYVDVVRYLVAV